MIHAFIAQHQLLSAVTSSVLALTLHPDVLCRAQAEIDSTIGRERLPTGIDKRSLPYIEAIMTETLRYGPPVPNGFPHVLLEDDVYDGYFIEKGTMVLPNLW